MKTKILCITLLIILTSCNENYSPKPLGFFRIDLSEKEYKTFENNCSYQFSAPADVDIVDGKNDCWYTLNYSKHNASVYLTYKKIDTNLEIIIEDNHKLVYDHSIRADGITEKLYVNEAEKVYGVLYDIHGNSASNLQFFLTDSSQHFLRGSLYFNETPNADSLLPVKEYIKEDFITLMESLKWL